MTTTLIGGVTTSIGTATATLNEDGTINEESRNAVLGTAVATTATVVGATILNDHTLDKIYEKYATAYIDSMSDKDLEKALADLDLLEKELNEKSSAKKI